MKLNSNNKRHSIRATHDESQRPYSVATNCSIKTSRRKCFSPLTKAGITIQRPSFYVKAPYGCECSIHNVFSMFCLCFLQLLPAFVRARMTRSGLLVRPVCLHQELLKMDEVDFETCCWRPTSTLQALLFLRRIIVSHKCGQPSESRLYVEPINRKQSHWF